MINIDNIFQQRTCYKFKDKKVSIDLLKEIYNITKLGPTSANSCPLRIVFLTSDNARKELLSCLMAGNVDKTKTAPVSAIFAYDLRFYNEMDKLFPHNSAMKEMFSGNSELAYDTAYRNSSLQAAYFMIIARSRGLDCGPMSGFDKDKLEKTFLSKTPNLKVNFICNLGYRDGMNEFSKRDTRLTFDEACQIV